MVDSVKKEIQGRTVETKRFLGEQNVSFVYSDFTTGMECAGERAGTELMQTEFPVQLPHPNTS